MKPELQHFAARLRQAMDAKKMNGSQLARQIWGTNTDKRGYQVAKNRDRIKHYLDGNSYPEPENLQKLADAVGIPVDELRGEPPNRATAPKPAIKPAIDRRATIEIVIREIHIKITPP
jgi:transcriptional regulator with XRE-family HTH domain